MTLNYNLFILTVAIIGVGIYSIEAAWGPQILYIPQADIKYLVLMLGICIITVIVMGHVYCWKYHPCINQCNIFRLYIANYEDIYINIYELKGVHIATSQAMLNIVVYQM